MAARQTARREVRSGLVGATLDRLVSARSAAEFRAHCHSLRHTFISSLAANGVHPKGAQQLARQSIITLTMDRYSHLGLIDMTAGLSVLPNITTPDAQECRATGTTDQTPIDADFSCTKSYNASAQVNRFQRFSTVADAEPTLNE